MVHIAFAGFAVDAVQHLCLAQRAERSGGQNLRLPAGKEPGAVHTGEKPDLGAKGSDLIHASAVHTLFVNQQPAAHDLLLHLVKQFFHLPRQARIFFGEFLHDGVIDGRHAGVTYRLVIGVQRVHQVFLAERKHLVKHIVIQLAGGVVKLRLADLVDNAVDEDQQIFDLAVCQHNGVIHCLIVHLVCARLNHNHLFGAGGNRQLQVALFAFLGVGVDNQFAVHKTDQRAADRTVPRNIRDGKGDGGTDHCGNLGRAVGVNRHHGQGQRHIVAQIFREQGADRAVDHTGGEHRFLRGFALSFQIPAGDFARGVHSLVIVNRQRQEIDPVARAHGRGGTAENGGLAVANQARAVCKPCHFTGFHHQRSAREGIAEHFVVFEYHRGTQCVFGHMLSLLDFIFSPTQV